MSDAEQLHGAEHVRRYRETDGEVGYIWRRGTTILLLTTTGRRTGEERTTPLIYREVDGAYVVVASQGGAPEHPDWYSNLVEAPDVTVQVRGEQFRARARTAGPDERPRLWELMNEVWPAYADYQEKTDREIPVVVIERD
jgi:deazaflavin-dependent oxidoreductase (nitroreductase family)